MHFPRHLQWPRHRTLFLSGRRHSPLLLNDAAFSSQSGESRRPLRAASPKWNAQRAATTLIAMRCRVGRVNDARQLFDTMPHRDVVAYSAMIHGSWLNGMFNDSIQIFKMMLRDGIALDFHAIASASLAAAGARCAGLTASIHGMSLKSGLESSEFVRTALLESYAKSGRARDACALFDRMRDPGLDAYTTMIGGLVHTGEYERAVMVFKRLLRRSATAVHVAAVINATMACSGCASPELCSSVHGYTVKVGVDSFLSVANSVLRMYLNLGNSSIAAAFLGGMVDKDVITWTTLMGFLRERHRADEILELFAAMRTSGIALDMVVVVHAVQACTFLGDDIAGRVVHGQTIAQGLISKVSVLNSLITFYCRCKDLDSARAVFDQIADKGSVSWITVVSGYVQCGDTREGIQLFSEMRREGKVSVDSVLAICLLAGCYEFGQLPLSEQFHSYSLKSGLLLCKPVQAISVAAYARCGHQKLARRLFDEIISQSVLLWITMVLSTHGVIHEESSKLLSMPRLNRSPVSLVSSSVDEPTLVFLKMAQNAFSPRQLHLGWVIGLLAHPGFSDVAKMSSNTTRQEDLIRCQATNAAMLAYAAAKPAPGMKQPDLSNATRLIDAYGSLGAFDVAESLRSSMVKCSLDGMALSLVEVLSPTQDHCVREVPATEPLEISRIT